MAKQELNKTQKILAILTGNRGSILKTDEVAEVAGASRKTVRNVTGMNPSVAHTLDRGATIEVFETDADAASTTSDVRETRRQDTVGVQGTRGRRRGRGIRHYRNQWNGDTID